MESSVTDQRGKNAAFDFYHAYLAVIYGLLATDGLEHVAPFLNGHAKWSPSIACLFLGTFLISLHFWFVCATVDDLSHQFYWILGGRKRPWFDFLLLVDAVVATGFAGGVLAMFQAIPPEETRFFLCFLGVAAMSLLYDFYSGLLGFVARRGPKEAGGRDTIERYAKKVKYWVKGDLIFVAGAAGIYFLHRLPDFGNSLVFGALFAVFAVLLLVLDVELIPLWTFRTGIKGGA